MRGKLRRLPILLVKAMAAVALVFAWTVVRDEVQTEPLVVLAQRIERGTEVDSKTVLRVADRVVTLSGDGRCESRFVRAGLTILLRRLDGLDPVRQSADFAVALGQTHSYLNHALQCTPTDGNLWLRRAMVGLAEGRALQTIRDDLAQSRRFAPAEANVLSGRFLVWNQLPETQLLQSAPLVLDDLKTICGKPGLMAKLPKAESALQNFLEMHARSPGRPGGLAAIHKMRRVDGKKAGGGPGLWCGQLLAS